MQLSNLTLDTPEENLALDEALLDSAETNSFEHAEILRVWEPRELMVVAGNSSRLAEEVHLEVCAAHNIPVLRRASGGATIVTGPGCLMYAVVLNYQRRPQLRAIDRAHRFVLESIATALNATLSLSSGETISRAGISDLVLGDKKFSGNSLRCKRSHFLYHGTLMFRFPLKEISRLLKMPSRQPTYRHNRSHADFVTNLPLDAAALRQALVRAFNAADAAPSWPSTITAQLAAEKYSRREWNERL